MRNLPRLLLFLGLAWFTFVLLREARTASASPDVDASRIVLLFGSVVLVGAFAGVLFVLMVMPAIGEAIGNFFFQPNAPAEKDAHSEAQAALARGEYETAVEEYRKVVELDPTDTLSYSEIAKISCEHLQDPAAAAEVLEQALQREWPADDAAFLSARLVDVYWKYQHDTSGARALLEQIIVTMPGSRHAANAQHRLQEIDRQLTFEE